MSTTPDPNDELTWRICFAAARESCREGEYTVAEDRCRRALAQAAVTGIADADRAELLDLLVDALMCQGHWDQVADLRPEWFGTLVRAHGRHSPQFVSCLLTLAEAARMNRDMDRSL